MAAQLYQDEFMPPTAAQPNKNKKSINITAKNTRKGTQYNGKRNGKGR